MTATDPVTDLKNDHRLIEAVLSALEQRLASAGEFPADFVEQALNFFVEFADRFHHFKEEESLFPALAGRGVPVEGGPIGMMLHEHNLGRKLLSQVRSNLEAARSGDARAQASVRSCAQQYTELLRAHIWKEDNILFMMAERALDEAASRKLMERYAEGAASSLGTRTVEQHRSFARDLTA